MALLEAFLIFIFAVIISSVINNRFPQIPTAFIQIALGVVIFIIPIQVDFQFNSEVFMFAVIAPLLFVEGTHVSRTKLLEYRKPIRTSVCNCSRCWLFYTLDLACLTNASRFCNSSNFMSY